jgi:hypothetical protein
MYLMLLGGLAALWPTTCSTHTKFSNTTSHVRVREYGLTCTVPLYKSKLLHQQGYGARARDFVNFGKCIARARRACAGWTVYHPMSVIPPNNSTYKSVQYLPSIGDPKLQNLLSHNGTVPGMVDGCCSCFFAKMRPCHCCINKSLLLSWVKHN